MGYPDISIETWLQITDGEPVVLLSVAPIISWQVVRKLTAGRRPAAVAGIGYVGESANKPELPAHIIDPWPMIAPLEPIARISPSQSITHGHDVAEALIGSEPDTASAAALAILPCVPRYNPSTSVGVADVDVTLPNTLIRMHEPGTGDTAPRLRSGKGLISVSAAAVAVGPSPNAIGGTGDDQY
jgi:hypothetical protein